MTEIPDWRGARGEKWSAQLTGMEATLQPVDEPLLDALALTGALRIAEIGSGGGGTTLELQRRAPAGSTIHGFDISPKLVEIARGRAAGRVEFSLADMGSEPPKQTYDRLVSRFGVMFFDDPRAAFANLARWLAPGGRFAFAVWAPPAENPWISIARDIVARFVEVPRPEPDAPGPFRYGDAARFVALLAASGFTDVRVADWRGVLQIGGGLPPAEAAHFALSAFSSYGELLVAGGGQAAFDHAHRALTEVLGEHVRGGGVAIAACVHIVTGARA